MATSNPVLFPARHIDRLPRPLAKALAAIVLLLHGILIALALRSIPLVELGGNSGGGGSGGSTLYVSVLKGQPASNVSHAQQSAVASENTRISKEKPEPGLIATHSASNKAVQTAPTVEKKTVQQTESTLLQQGAAEKTDGTATTKGTGSNTDRGTGQGTGNGNDPGAGHGENTGNNFGSGGSGTGSARSVSLSQLRYKHAFKPEYPARSIQRHESGQVNIQVVVDTSGRVHDARVVSSSGFDRLDEAALKAARRSTFYPYMEHGRPMYAKAIIPYRFNLNNR